VIITRILERKYDVIQCVKMREDELQAFLMRQKVERVDQLTKKDWEDIWASLEESEEDDFTERVYDPTLDDWFGNYDYKDNVKEYRYKEKENNNE
jgi:hypothetical protein